MPDTKEAKSYSPIVIPPEPLVPKKKKGPKPLHEQAKMTAPGLFRVLHADFDVPVPGTGGKQHVTYSKGDVLKSIHDMTILFPNSFARVDTPESKRRTVMEMPTIKDADPTLKHRAKTALANALAGTNPGASPSKADLDAAAEAERTAGVERAKPAEDDDEGADATMPEPDAVPLGDEVTDTYKKLIGDMPYQVYYNPSNELFSIVNTKKHKVVTRKTTGKVKAFFKSKSE